MFQTEHKLKQDLFLHNVGVNQNLYPQAIDVISFPISRVLMGRKIDVKEGILLEIIIEDGTVDHFTYQTIFYLKKDGFKRKLKTTLIGKRTYFNSQSDIEEVLKGFRPLEDYREMMKD